MIYRDYTLSPISRLLPGGNRVEQIEIAGERHTYADSIATAKRAIDGWERKRLKGTVESANDLPEVH